MTDIENAVLTRYRTAKGAQVEILRRCGGYAYRITAPASAKQLVPETYDTLTEVAAEQGVRAVLKMRGWI